MTTWTALTTIKGEGPAYALGERIEELPVAPTALAVLEVEDGSGMWEVGAYYTEKPDPVALDLLAAAAGAAPFAVTRLEDRDWVEQVRRELTPVEAGRFVVHGAHDAHRAPRNRIALQIEAAMAFGTGHHGTTRGCLLALDGLADRGFRAARTADIGCGTGVLGMAAAALWRGCVVATDIDPVAVETARANARVNGLAPWMRIGRANGLRADLVREAAPYGLIFANILARPLRGLAPDIARMCAPGGRAVLSGILNEQADWVEGMYRAHGFARERRIRLGEWTTLQLRRL
ncbi:50S ribosomal protein L11 methyltransferase [Oceanicella actignis]|uniref:Ribosomal protein L11 methyltransferase n=1 Tax=Oceanicella actignis TaxID=1189325 RepID=A0A1M7TSG9_9RHOB|nr:50S ribosomal protein L11 methyltransferase [Oceanicella actignis]TYO85396.1 ribosomal protein L11 methyltransferase [Oceanicella actignis]SET76726.1 [LSU ribosomal protein L11P]-lysine N-methyltransferase [Oceanicella actignis]SHN73665.1 ribosomal protein L11 methyltransferase [Oceanicella actignis]